VANFVKLFMEYSFLFPLVQKYKNRPRKARIIVKNNVARFFMVHGVYKLTNSAVHILFKHK